MKFYGQNVKSNCAGSGDFYVMKAQLAEKIYFQYGMSCDHSVDDVVEKVSK